MTDADRCDDVEVAEVVQRGLHVGLAGAVGDEDQAGLVAEALLLHRADRHAVAPNTPATWASTPGRSSTSRLQVVRGLELVDGPDARPGQRPDAGVGALAQVGGGVDQVAEHGAGRGRPPAPRP